MATIEKHIVDDAMIKLRRLGDWGLGFLWWCHPDKKMNDRVDQRLKNSAANQEIKEQQDDYTRSLLEDNMDFINCINKDYDENELLMRGYE